MFECIKETGEMYKGSMSRISAERMMRLKKEKRMRRRRMILLSSAFIILITCAIFSLAHLAYAGEDKTGDVRSKYYRSVMIYAGDSVDSFADGYISEGYDSRDSFAKEIMHINGLNTDTELIPGNHLIIPYFR